MKASLTESQADRHAANRDGEREKPRERVESEVWFDVKAGVGARV
jgi:hypothetical protein